MERTIIQAIITVILLLANSQALPIRTGPTSCHLQPTEIAIRSEDIATREMGKDNCSPYPPSITSDSEVDPTQHIRCTHPTRLTDSDTGPTTYTEDIAADVYVSGNSAEQLLFIFPTSVSITAINLLYYSNTEDQGHPKLRLYAVPENFNVWDTVDSSYPSIFIDEALPGSEETGLRNVTREAGFQTTRVLLTKSESKNYNFVMSEVEFFTCDPDTIVTESTTTETETTTASTTGSSSEFPSLSTPEIGGILGNHLQHTSGQERTHSYYSIQIMLTVWALFGMLAL